ncbi:MAG: hypothetical protein GY696_00210 [Gammaproteobacteria bacterium]|nr:hypothetical protein [Gammaproteobacteria bacterium]
MKKSTLIKFSAMVITIGLMTGCASTEQMKQMDERITKAQKTADAALAAANAADAKAGTALSAANAAQASADDANGRIDTVEQKMDRMMEKAMSK